MSFSATGSVKIDEINTSELDTNSNIKTTDLPPLEDSSTDFRNKIQACEAKLPISKADAAANDIFTTYTAKLQLRIYTSKDDTAPTNLIEHEFEVELTAPAYATEEWDEYDDTWYENVENEFFILQEDQKNTTITLADGTDSVVNQDIWIDTWVNKEYTRPDLLEITFSQQGTTEKLEEGKYVFSWVQFERTDGADAGTKNTIACVNKIVGEGEDPEF